MTYLRPLERTELEVKFYEEFSDYGEVSGDSLGDFINLVYDRGYDRGFEDGEESGRDDCRGRHG